MIYFTSDTHFFHENILKLDNRPFKDMNDMCDKMLEKWNNKVNKNDTVYILGDYTWKQSDEHIEYLKKLNGRKRLILGNHDFRNSSNKYKDLFESIKDYDEVKITDFQAELQYNMIQNLLVDVGAKVGYRILNIDLDDDNDSLKMEFKGPYVGLEAHF